MKAIPQIALAVFCIVAPALAKEDPSAAINAALSGLPAPELPAKAALLIKAAKPSTRETVSVQVVKTAFRINPAAATTIIGAIARAVPDVAAIAAGAAAAEQPDQAANIAKAAAAAAPKQAGGIVAAVCRAVPGDYHNIARAVAAVAPKMRSEILKGVGNAVPELKTRIEPELSGSASVGSILDQSRFADARPVVSPSAGLPKQSGDIIPIVPVSSTVTNSVPNTTGPSNPGSRNYSRP